MMLSKTIQDAINDQIKHEFYSAYLYLSMSASCESANLPGTAKWLRLQAGEEQEHALKFFDYLHDRGATAVLQAIPQPPAEFGSISALFQQVLEHEQKVTSLIIRLYELAVSENDYATQSLLRWFIDEQVEEEKNATSIVAQLQMLGTQGAALFMMDRQLGARAG